jgi:hypothetical protein
MTEQAHMARHPDLIELRRRYDAASASPIAEGAAGLALLGAVFLAASATSRTFALPAARRGCVGRR